MSGNDVTDIEEASFIAEGFGDEALKMYFESDQN